MFRLLRRNIEREISLTDEEWNTIIEKAEYIKLKKNELLQSQNSHTTYECFIIKGAIKTYTLSEKGTENVIFFSFKNEWACDLESFYHKKPTRYNIKAMEETDLLIINKSNKALLFKEVPKLIQFHIVMMERSNIVIQKRLLDILNKPSRQRYAEFIKRYPKTTHAVSDKNLSAYLGVSHEFLSKIKKDSTVSK